MTKLLMESPHHQKNHKQDLMKKMTTTITHQFSRTLGVPPLLLCFMCLSLNQYLSAQIHHGNLTLQTQQDVADFNYTEVTGNLYISGASITDLSGLSGLTSIRGSLRIRRNERLQSLSGLESLTSIGGYLYIWENAQLQDLSGLPALTSIGGDFYIGENAQLQDLSGLSSPTSIGGWLSIGGNAQLQDLSGLPPLTSIGEGLSIRFNPQLQDLSGLPPLISIEGGLSINGNDGLQDLSGLPPLTSIGGNLIIKDNAQLQDLSGLPPLTSIGWYLIIEGNAQLQDLSGLPTLTSIGRDLIIEGNAQLQNLSGLPALTSIGGDLIIESNAQLQDLSGLPPLTSIGGGLYINDNDGLQDLSGLPALTSIGVGLSIGGNAQLQDLSGLPVLTSIGWGGLYISNNAQLQDLSGLPPLTSIGGWLRIRFNGQLQDLSGLSTLCSVEGNLTIADNPALTNCCGIAQLLNTPGAVWGSITISRNATPCDSETAIKDNCPAVTADCSTCTFTAECIEDNTINEYTACDLSVLPDPITDYTQLFTNIGDEPCGAIEMAFDRQETGDICTGLDVEYIYTLFDDENDNQTLDAGEASVSCSRYYKVTCAGSLDVDMDIVGVDYPTSGECGNFNVLADVSICNDGDVDIYDLDISLDDLTDQANGIFAGNAEIVGIVSGVDLSDDLNDGDFDGVTYRDLFDGETGTLEPGECTVVRVKWEVAPGEASVEEASEAKFKAGGTAIAGEDCETERNSGNVELGNCWHTSRIAAANDNINVSSDEGCDGIITPDMILENHYGACDTGAEYPMGGFYRLRYLIPGSDELSDPALYLDLDRADFPDGRVIIHVENVGNACDPLWGEISLEDKTAPAFDCTPAHIYQTDGRYLYCTDIDDVLDGTLVLPAPTVSDNCDDDVETWYKDVLSQTDDCDDATITRTWYAVDDAGNEAVSCVQTIRFSKPSLDQISKPDDEVKVNCDFVAGLLEDDNTLTEADLLDANGHPTPLTLELLHGEGAGYPYFGDQVLDDSYCNIGASYKDISVIEVCENTVKIVRQWTILDWCDIGDQNELNNGTLVNHRQIIKFGDFSAPVLTDPGDAMTVGTTAFGCEGKLTIPGLASDLIEENCSEVTVRATLHKTTMEPTFDQYGRPTGEAPVTADLGSVTIGSSVDVEVGATYTIKYVATDACGNTSNEVDLDVTVEDDDAPVAVCDDDLHISIGGLGYAQVKDTDVDEGSWDNCGPVELWVSRKLADETLRDAYLVFVYDGLTFDDLVLSGLDDKDNDSDADIYVVDEDGDGVWDSNETHEVLRYKDEMWFTWWRDEVAFICEDVTTRVTIELLAEDAQGLTNKCWNDVLIEDKIRPVCDVDPEVVLDCTDLPYGFDPADPDDVAALPGVTAATATDNCEVDAILDTVILKNWNCNSGTIERRFTVTDKGGLISINQCVQTIVVNPVNHYEIIFPKDPDPVVCGDAVLDDIETNIIACDLLTVNVVNDTFTASGTACYKIKRTYSVINWCEYDGEASPVEIGRDEDDDGTTGEHNVYVLRDAVLTDGYIDDDADEKDKPLRKTVSTGYWTYIQYIKVIDNIAPVVEIGGDDVFCSYDNVDCDTEVTVPFTVTDECAGSDVLVKVFVDGAQVDLEEADYPNYSIKENLGRGEHEIEIHVVDGCGNSQLATRTIRVADCKAPSPICINGLAVELMRTEAGTDVDGDGEDDPAVMVIWATDFEVSPGEDCTGPVRLSIHRVDETPHPDSTSLTLTCKDPDTLTVRIYAWDNADSPIAIQPDAIEPGGPNYDFCETYVVVQDNLFNLCNDPGQIGVAGLIENEDNETIENVSVSLSGMLSDNRMTAADGNYAFHGLTPDGDYTITPLKDDDYLNGVSTFDLVLITKHILGTKKLTSPYQLIAADANNSKRISALDLIQLRKLILSVNRTLPSNTSWRFIPASYQFPDPENPWAQAFPEVLNYNDLQTTIASGDFVAVKIGDVNGNARPNSLVSDRRSVAGVFNLSVEDQSLVAGNEYRIAFTADQFVQGYQFTLQHTGLELMDIEYGVAKAENFGVVEDGVLTTSWNTSSEAEPRTSGELFTLVVRAKVDGQLSELLSVNSRYTTAEAYNPADELMDVALTFSGQTVTEGYELYQNVPNPFQGQTMISFRLPSAMQATIKIQDVTGKTLKVIRGEYARGFNQISVNSSELASTGVLYYILKTDQFTASKKMVIVE
jgi:hypothetical protein